MPRKTALAALSGLGAGVACTIAAVDGIDTGAAHGIILLTAVRLFPAICVTLVALAALRHWIIRHEERSRRDMEALAARRRHFEEECQRRTSELNAREERINRTAEESGAQFMRLARRLDETLVVLTHVRREHSDLRNSYNELAADHNRLIMETLQERQNMFARGTGKRPASRPATPPKTVASPNPPVPVRIRGHIRQLPDQPRHDRADIVSGPS
jgi:hypothetical protein